MSDNSATQEKKGIVKTIINFFTEKIWNADFSALRFLKRSVYSLCRLLVVAICGFIDDRCTLQSCALTYITMVSLVPILAIALSFCKGLGLQRQLLAHLGIETFVQTTEGNAEETYVYRVVHAPEEPETTNEEETSPTADDGTLAEESIPVPEGTEPASETRLASEVKPGFAAELPEPMQIALIKIFSYVDKTNFAALGVIGVVTLLATVIMSIKKLENNFNEIWCVKRGRTVLRQISEYLVVVLLLPILLFCVLSLSAFISSGSLARMLQTDSAIAIYWGQLMAKLLLFFCLIASFAALYLFMPNTRVRLGPAFMSGAVSAVCWGIVLLAYIKWQIGLARYNAIYGTFAALPFFLAWLYTNWLVILLGAEICFAAQNQRLLRQTKQLKPLEAGASRLLGIAIVEAISRHYDDGKGCWNAGEYALKHNVSIRELEFTLASLVKAGLVIQRTPAEDPPASYDYILGLPASQITLSMVSDAFLGIETETAKRFEKCLPPKFVNYMKDQHQILATELDKITFDHFAVNRPTIEDPQNGSTSAS